jgi:hypothetical protein
MTQRDSVTAFNHDGVHLVDGTDPVAAEDAGCSIFTAVKAIGGDVVIASIDGAPDVTGTTADIPLSDGDVLLMKFTGITRDAGSTGWLALTKVK